MEKKPVVHTIIQCSNCHKGIPVGNYRIHVWYCSKTQQINPRLQQLFKSQIKMSQDLHMLIKQQQQKQVNQQTFPCAYCNFPMKFTDFDTHPIQCPQLPVKCAYCPEIFPKGLMDQHQEYCQNKKKIPLDLLNPIQLQTKKSSAKDLDQPTVDEHMEFVVRQIASLFGVRKPEALSNRQLVNLPLETFVKNKENQEQCCAICYIDFENHQRLVLLPCGHRFHRRCMCNWFSVANTCPTCRFEIEKKKYTNKK